MAVSGSGESYDVLKRRRSVFKLRLMGLMVPQIAESLKVSIRTIERDLEWLRKEAKTFIKDFDEKEDIGLFMRKMQELEKMYMMEYNKASNIPCPDCGGTGENLSTKNEKIKCSFCKGTGKYENTKIKLVVINKIQELNMDIAKIKAEIGLWPAQEKKPIDEKSYESKIIEIRKTRGLLPEPEEGIIAKAIRELKEKEKGGKKKL